MVSEVLEKVEWEAIPWQDFMALSKTVPEQKASFYYENGWMRIEMSPVGFRHGRSNSIISNVITLFATFKNIPVIALTNASFRKSGIREFQPDAAFYIGKNPNIPPDTDSPINLNRYDSPSLVIEIASSSLNDDLGRKRLMYERSQVREYWVVDVNELDVIAFTIADGRSGEVQVSEVLPGLEMAVVEEALNRSQNEEDGAINRWLIEKFSQN